MIHFFEASLFNQLVAILVLASLIGVIAVRLGQPLIVAFIITGLIAGPEAFDLIGHEEEDIIETLAQFGIALLLFMVGLKLDLRIIKQSGPVALLTGVLQVFATFALGFGLAFALGLDVTVAAFVGIGLAFSSTIIVVKLLSDKRAIDSLYGRMALGILIVQDLIVILLTILITAFLGPAEDGGFSMVMLGTVLLKGAGLAVLTALFIRFGAQKVTRLLGKNGELMAIFCIAFALLAAAACEQLGFSKELGGLLAGISLASTPYNNIIASRLAVLRDFLLLFFFAQLGMHISFEGIEEIAVPALVLSVFVLLGKPLIIMGITSVMRFRKRTGFMTGLALGQISEFSLILMAMGMQSGLVDENALNLMTMIGLVTMWISTYGIIYGSRIYGFLETRSPFFARQRKIYREERDHREIHRDYDVVIFGLGRYGEAMAKAFVRSGHRVLGVDFNPEAIMRAKALDITVVYGDAADPEFPAHLHLDKTRVAVFAFHHYMTGPMITDLRRTLAKALRDHGFSGHIAATSHHPEYDQDLVRHGIDIVLNPFEDAALQGVDQIEGVMRGDVK